MNLRILDFSQGTAMVVTDLHGNWDSYTRYRDRFLALYRKGKAQRLILCGDLIHSDLPLQQDFSLQMIQDVMQLQSQYGNDVVVMLLGNHEMPHIYGIPLWKGELEYTARFEATLWKAGKKTRSEVFNFLVNLPLYIRTSAGVMISHAGAAWDGALLRHKKFLSSLNHHDILQRIQLSLESYAQETSLEGYDLSLRARFFCKDREFKVLWQILFSGNEKEYGLGGYRSLLAKFLQVWSEEIPQRVLVAGHIAVAGGYQILFNQLRIASAAHAYPKESGLYLLLDCTRPVNSAEELIPWLGSVF